MQEKRFSEMQKVKTERVKGHESLDHLINIGNPEVDLKCLKDAKETGEINLEEYAELLTILLEKRELIDKLRVYQKKIVAEKLKEAEMDLPTGALSSKLLDKHLNELLIGLNYRNSSNESMHWGSGFVMAIDVDNLKETNTKYGHLAGTEALKSIVSAVKATTRTSDRIFRMAGASDEFIVILYIENDISDEDLKAKYEIIQMAINNCYITVGNEKIQVPVTAATGYETLHKNDQERPQKSAEEILDLVDKRQEADKKNKLERISMAINRLKGIK